MNTSHHTHHNIHAALRVSEQLKPFSEEKDPMIAAVCGFFFGGVGLGLYFKSWADLAMPVFLWLVCVMFAPVTIATSYIAAGFFCAAYGYRRAKASNERLRAQRADTVIDVEPPPVIRVQPPPLPAFRPVPELLTQQVQPQPQSVLSQIQERLTQLTALRDLRLISDADFEAKKQEILGNL